jgi:hypothetical protein
MENSNMLVLMHRQMEITSPEGMVDVMLTPQFYTMKREALPVKYAYQAKKIAPSLFDGLLEEHGVYDYFVYREGETWIFIAYDTEEIIDFLKAKGIPPEKIGRLFFAQQALEHFTAPVQLGEKEFLSVIDRTVVVVPGQALPKTEAHSFDERFRPKRGVRLEMGKTSLFTRRQAAVLAVILLCFGMIWLIEGWRYGEKNHRLKTELETLYRDYPALQSTYARESVAFKYRTIDKRERRKRKIVGKIAGLIFKGVTLTRFELNDKTFKAHFTVKDQETVKRLGILVKSAGFRQHKEVSGNGVVIEGEV